MYPQYSVRAVARKAQTWAPLLALFVSLQACSGDDPDAPSGNIDTDSGAPDSATDPDGNGDPTDPDAETPKDPEPRYALFTASNYVDEAQLSVIDLNANSIAGHLSFEDQDTVPYASRGRGFALHRTDGAVSFLDAASPFQVAHTVDIRDGDASTNPYAAIVAAGKNVYIARYAHNSVTIANSETGQAEGVIDLSAFLHPDDPDGFVEVSDGVYDPKTDRAYFLLGRIDQNDFGPGPDYVGKCVDYHAVIVGVDTNTHEIVDLNGDAPGEAIELRGQNPDTIVADFANSRLIVAHAGCYIPTEDEADEPERDKRGIEAVALDSGATDWLYETKELERLSGLLWLDEDRAYVGKGFPTQWYRWQPSQATLGDNEPSIPEHPIWDGERVVGLELSEEGKTNVVAFDPETNETSSVVEDIFTDPGLFTSGSAVIR